MTYDIDSSDLEGYSSSNQNITVNYEGGKFNLELTPDIKIIEEKPQLVEILVNSEKIPLSFMKLFLNKIYSQGYSLIDEDNKAYIPVLNGVEIDYLIKTANKIMKNQYCGFFGLGVKYLKQSNAIYLGQIRKN